uniref:Integrase catalytic domain-containing protein n=1 Tax=Micrurus spixii TaxID=129469 RepID=A0A2D4M3G9_9SAUR
MHLIYFIKLPQVGRLKYLLVTVDHLTAWVEAYPATTAALVTKIILEQIIPRYGIVDTTDSNSFFCKSASINHQVWEFSGNVMFHGMQIHLCHGPNVYPWPCSEFEPVKKGIFYLMK